MPFSETVMLWRLCRLAVTSPTWSQTEDVLEPAEAVLEPPALELHPLSRQAAVRQTAAPAADHRAFVDIICPAWRRAPLPRPPAGMTVPGSSLAADSAAATR